MATRSEPTDRARVGHYSTEPAAIEAGLLLAKQEARRLAEWRSHLTAPTGRVREYQG